MTEPANAKASPAISDADDCRATLLHAAVFGKRETPRTLLDLILEGSTAPGDGVKIEWTAPDRAWLRIATNSAMAKHIFANTPWHGGAWRQALRQLPLSYQQAARFHGVPRDAISFPLHEVEEIR